MTIMIGIIDYNAGNITSVERALKANGSAFLRADNPAAFEKSSEAIDRLIFPGVGEASYAMEQLAKTGFDSFLKDWCAKKKPLLGICLGSQIIFDWSEEGNTKCLGLIPGTIRHFSVLWKERQPKPDELVNDGSEDFMLNKSLKVPHIGWNDVTFCNGGSALCKGVSDKTDFYFVHSYVIQPDDPAVIKGYTDYGALVPAVVEYENITAFQFHPEKSGEAGLRILKNFAGGV